MIAAGVYAGFGDIDLDETASELFAVNLFDRRIYRLSVPDGTLLGAFAHGAVRESWGADGYPIALGFRDGWLYHGVAPDPSELHPRREAVIYRSRPDGTDMKAVARFALNYRMPGQAYPHDSAIVADIAFRPDGDVVLGLSDRTIGDLLPARVGGRGWTVTLDREHYTDRTFYDEAATGSLAAFPRADRVVAAAAFVNSRTDPGALWFDNVTGAILAGRTRPGPAA